MPKGVQNLAESSSTSSQTASSCRRSAPTACATCRSSLTLFFFILIGNLFEIIPFFQMPANARMAHPMILALITWVFFIASASRTRAPLKYFKNIALPAGRAHGALHPRRAHRVPLDLHRAALLAGGPALRQHARRPHPAGDLRRALQRAVHGRPSSVRSSPFGMLVALTGFELMVAFLQAYIFTILAAVYIGGALHPEH